jgi:hypothetical protein
VLTKPTEGTFNKLTVAINGGPNADAIDSFPVSFTFSDFAIDNLTDQDINAIVQIVVNRIISDHPNYMVYVNRAWTGFTSDPQDTVYTPPDFEPIPGEQS